MGVETSFTMLSPEWWYQSGGLESGTLKPRHWKQKAWKHRSVPFFFFKLSSVLNGADAVAQDLYQGGEGTLQPFWRRIKRSQGINERNIHDPSSKVHRILICSWQEIKWQWKAISEDTQVFSTSTQVELEPSLGVIAHWKDAGNKCPWKWKLINSDNTTLLLSVWQATLLYQATPPLQMLESY